MTFQELLAENLSWVGGNIETIEDEVSSVNGKILGFFLDNNVFTVYNTDTDITVNIEYGKVTVINDRIIKITIPYIGVAYLYRPAEKVKCSCKCR